MALGYSKPLYLLAFDHRGSFERDLFSAKPPISDEVRAGIIAAKEIIYDGFVEAVRRGVPVEAAGVLTDEQYGAGVARRAKVDGHLLAMPVERSGQLEFEFEYGEDFGVHIEAFDPTFVKVLVRYNPEGDADLNARQTERLARLASWLHERRRLFLFELLVPATPGQLDAAGEDHRRYDRDVRPGLVVRTIEALQAGAVEPDIWKIEGLDEAAACAEVVAAPGPAGATVWCASSSAVGPTRPRSSNGCGWPLPCPASTASRLAGRSGRRRCAPSSRARRSGAPPWSRSPSATSRPSTASPDLRQPQHVRDRTADRLGRHHPSVMDLLDAWTVKFDPAVVADVASVSDGVAKIVGESDDYDSVPKGQRTSCTSSSTTTSRRHERGPVTPTSPTPTSTKGQRQIPVGKIRHRLQ